MSSITRITVFGAGAIGGHLAVRLGQLPGLEVSVVARGAHLEAIRRDGLELCSGGETWRIHPMATDDPAQLPEQDLVIAAVKAPAIAPSAEAMARLAGGRGLILFMLNGLPWWMEPGDRAAGLAAVDRGRVLGGVAYSSNYLERPGRVRHTSHDGWLVGEPDGGRSPRAAQVAALLARAGLDAREEPAIRRQIWRKLIYNASGNPVAALTRLACDGMLADRAVYDLSLRIRREVAAIAASQGEDFSGEPMLASLDDLVDAGGARPSMLQDALAGRAMEVDAIIDAPRRIAARAGVPTPALDIVSALAGGLDRAIRQG